MTNLSLSATITILNVTWDPPHSSSEHIFAYEVEYWPLGHRDDATRVTTTDLGIVLDEGEIIIGRVVVLSVRAYTSEGPGKNETIQAVCLEKPRESVRAY